MRLGTLFIAIALTSTSILAGPPNVTPPGAPMELPPLPTSPDAPQIYEHSQEAGPDETFFLTGKNLTKDVFVWGNSPDNPAGAPVPVRVQLSGENHLAVTLPDKAYDGPFVVAVKNQAGYSAPIVLNAPQLWWCTPAKVEPKQQVCVFGRNLARRPDQMESHVYLVDANGSGRWLATTTVNKYKLAFNLPEEIEPGAYAIWVHAGGGGKLGWGGPLRLEISKPATEPNVLEAQLKSPDDLQQAIDAMAKDGGGRVELPEGTFPLHGTLRIPAGVTLHGVGSAKTKLQMQYNPQSAFARLDRSGWNQGPTSLHNVGDTLTYHVDAPQAGRYAVWLRYATEMSPWNQPGVSGNMTLAADDQPPVRLENLPNTGGFGTYRWSKSADLDLAAGGHTLTWKNVRGGGITLDAFVFTLDLKEVISDAPLPAADSRRVVLQAEDCVKMAAKDGRLPAADRAAVWLMGDRAGVENLAIFGSAQVNIGIAVRSPVAGAWLDGCKIEGVKVADCEGKHAENCAVHLHNLRNGKMEANILSGRTPIFLSGVRRTSICENLLCSATRFGGNSEAAILGRTEPIEECVFEGNSFDGASAGGPVARRMIWLSTGHGSIVHNYLAGNRPLVTRMDLQFGGVAGTDQNVGEMILFEGNHRTAYFGPLAGGDPQSVTLPETIDPTPDDRLGNVRRDQLAHDAQGRETPFWPPDADDGSQEPPISEYFVTVFSGPGWGQTRRVVKREGPKLLLDKPWRVPPEKSSVVAVGVMFYQNLIVDNECNNGMTGVQLWISCVENVIAGNKIARQRKPGLFLYGNGTTLASSMPRTWNRGISPLFWNLAEGNTAEECSEGAIVTSGDAANLPIEFPRALGNVLRHNTFTRSRFNGVLLASRKGSDKAPDTSASVFGTIAEFNVVRDAPVAYHAGNSTDAVVWRRNHAYFWAPASNPDKPPVAFQTDNAKTIVVQEANTIEGPQGVPTKEIVVQKGPEEEKRGAEKKGAGKK